MSEPARNEPIDTFLARQFGDKPESRVLQDSARAGEIDARLRAEPSPDGVSAPISLGVPNEVPPVAYVLHVWTIRCTICQSQHQWSEIFCENHLRGTWGSFVRNLSPVKELLWNVPLKVHNLTTRTVVGCFECADALQRDILPSLRKPPVPQAVVKLAPSPTASTDGGTPATRSPKRPVSTDDFLV